MGNFDLHQEAQSGAITNKDDDEEEHTDELNELSDRESEKISDEGDSAETAEVD